MKTCVITKNQFKESKYSLFEWMQCLDTCLFHKAVRNNIVEDLHESCGDTVVVFVFDAYDEPMGFAYASVCQDQMFIRYISCKEKSKGYGSALVRELESFAVSKNIHHIELISTITSKPFYLKHGYVYGSVDSIFRRSLRIAQKDDPYKLIPFVKYTSTNNI